MYFSLSAWFEQLNTAQKLSIFKFVFLFHFVVIFYSLSSCLLPARPLFLIVLHNSVKNIHVIKAWFVTWYRNGKYVIETCGILKSFETLHMYLDELLFRVFSIFWFHFNYNQSKKPPLPRKTKNKTRKKQIKGKADAKKQDYTLPTDYGKMAKQ